MDNQGVRLKEIIRILKYSNKDFAKKIGVAPNYISILINNPSKINDKFIYNIANVFPQININWLLTGEGKSIINQSNNLLKEEPNTYQLPIHTAPNKHKKAVSNRFKEMLQLVNNRIKVLENKPQTIDNLKELKKAHLFKLELLDSLEDLKK